LTTEDVLHAWGRILAGRAPSLAIEVTRECPLSCPGCYFHNENHLGKGRLRGSQRDYKGRELVDRVLDLVAKHRPLHVSLVGGEPLLRHQELSILLPLLEAGGLHTQVVTSAVLPIPAEWSRIRRLDIAVSVDGLPAEHDSRRKPATYERIIRNIAGHRVVIHCTVTRQMAEKPGYLREFVRLWSAREEVRRIWVSLYTPQIGETGDLVLTPEGRRAVADELMVLREEFPKLGLPEGLIRSYLNPPKSPDDCIFAKTTVALAPDLKTRITPCPLGGEPDCSQCGCMGAAGLQAVGRHRLPVIGLRVGAIYNSSYMMGRFAAGLRHVLGSLLS